MNNKNNQFARYAYSPYNSNLSGLGNGQNAIYQASAGTRTVFTGGDIGAYINQIPVTNLESAAWSIQVDVVPNYVMGSRDAVVYTTGRRQISGTLIFSQYDRHAVLEQIFQLSALGYQTQGQLWASDTPGSALYGVNSSLSSTTPTTFNGVAVINSGQLQGNLINPVPTTGISLQSATPLPAGTNVVNTTLSAMGLRGITASQYNQFVQQAAKQTAQVIGSTNLNYVDQLPPFDLTLVGIARSGAAAKCSIFGIQCTTESGGMSSADISNAIGISYVALGVSPWRPIQSLGNQVFIPPTQ